MLCLGCQTVIITLGEDGAVFASSKEPKPIHIRAPKVEQVVDTTVSSPGIVTEQNQSNINNLYLFFLIYNHRVPVMHLLVPWPIT